MARGETVTVIASPQGVAIQWVGLILGRAWRADKDPDGEAAKMEERTGLPRRCAPRNDGSEIPSRFVIASPQGVAIQ
ncbi:hypothetical protein CCR84_09255 [Rhodocyclus purpureus]|nr:hypothetical protein [Rhodocyclus purpureus]